MKELSDEKGCKMKDGRKQSAKIDIFLPKSQKVTFRMKTRSSNVKCDVKKLRISLIG